MSYHILFICKGIFLFHLFSFAIVSSEFQILLVIMFLLHLQCFSFLSWDFALLPFLSLVVPSRSHPQPPPISDENILADTFSAGWAHHDHIYIERGRTRLFTLQKAKHLCCESLTMYLRTQTERTKASRKCFCHGNLHLSSIQLCFKESHLNIQYISCTIASDPIWEIHS